MLQNKIVFFYQNAFSKTGGIQTFNKYFISALEEISKESENTSAQLVSIYDDIKDINTSLPIQTLKSSKLAAFKYVIMSAKSFNTFIFAHVNLAPLAIVLHIVNPKARIIFCTHGIEIWRKLPKLTESIMNKSTILTVSSFSKNELLKYNPDLNDIRLFPNCIRMQDINKTFENPYNENEFNILSVTRLSKGEELKGIDTMIETIPIVIKTIPNMKYTVIGKGEDIIRLKSIAKELDVEKYVNFLGFVEDINAYYQHCDLFSLLSKKEGFGIVYLEAMQYKKPIIACNYGGPIDVIDDNKTGFLCDCDDVISISENIINLFKNNELKKILGHNGLKKLLENFTYESFKANLKQVLEV